MDDLPVGQAPADAGAIHPVVASRSRRARIEKKDARLLPEWYVALLEKNSFYSR
jgi:hypothetical protein